MSHETMLITVNTQHISPKATPVATDLPCRHSFDAKRPLGYVQALAGSPAR
jgi:hypothetical protein